MKRPGLAFLLVCPVLTVACEAPFSNEAVLARNSLPNQDSLRIAVPKTIVATPPPGSPDDGPARFYLDTLRTAETLNLQLFDLLSIVGEVTKSEPIVLEDDAFIWGPINPDNGDFEFLLLLNLSRTSTVVRSTSTSTAIELKERFFYDIIAQRVTGSTPIRLLGGWAAPRSESFGDPGIGRFWVNYDALELVDQGQRAFGTFAVGYDSREAQITIEVAAVLNASLGISGGVDAFYNYQVQPDEGCGSLAFFMKTPEDTDIIPGPGGPEILGVGAQWLDEGPGRADVTITGGDLPSWIPFYFAAECWGPMFERVWFATNVPENPNEPGFSSFGDEQFCFPKFQGDFRQD